MKLLGVTEIAAHMRVHPNEAEMLRAWAGEIKHKNWESAEAMAADFLNVNISPPTAIFRLGRSITVETLIDFRKKVVLLTALRQPHSPSTFTPQ